MPYVPSFSTFTPSGSTPSSTPPVAFTPPGVGHSTTAPTAFTPSNITPGTTPPALFFPLVSSPDSLAVLALEPTLLITPAASEVVFTFDALTWYVWTLTAGTHSGDSTHVIPNDYDPVLNAKYWTQTGSGKVLIDSSGNALVDGNGNILAFL